MITQEEKELLLKDLCARLPYYTLVKVMEQFDDEVEDHFLEIHPLSTYDIEGFGCGKYSRVLPYLRPMSSITKEEKEELKQLSYEYLEEWTNAQTSIDKWKLDAKSSYNRSVFYNSHHLDWNGLIPKGLAIEVTEENNPYKD